MSLRHRGLCSIENVRNQLLAVRERLLRAVDIPGLLLIYEKQMTRSWSAADIDILAYLDEAISPEDCEPSIAPGRQAIGSEPIAADVAAPLVTPEHRIAKILEPGILRMIDIPDLRGHNVSSR